ncbi:MAG: hypothetical protein R3266_04075 [Gemmatimonadota bacterium]|nr:hypothetical protein [Gemmatimonadota bacterium]
MRRHTIAFALLALTPLSCGGGDVTGPLGESLCNTRLGLEVCVDRAEVRQGRSVTVTIENVSAGPIFKDGCATKAVGKTSSEAAFEEVYNPTLRCGSGAGPAEIVAAMVELEPGEVLEESVEIPFFAFQGFYRVNVWVLDEAGELAAPRPAFSGTFEVFRTAD